MNSYVMEVRRAEDVKANPQPMQNGLREILFVEREDIAWVMEKSILQPSGGCPLEVWNKFPAEKVTGVLYICVNEDFPEEIWVTKNKTPNHLRTNYTRIFKFIEDPKETESDETPIPDRLEQGPDRERGS